MFGLIKDILCPKCHGRMKFVVYLKKSPSKEVKFQKELEDYVNSINH